MDLLKELSSCKLQKGDFDKFKFIVNNLLESHATIIRRNQALLSTRAFEKNYDSGPTS